MAKGTKNATNYLERKKVAMHSKVEVWQTRLAGLLVILALCIHPLYVNAERYLYLTRHKFTFFVIYMAVILVAVIVIWIYRVTRKPLLLPQDSPYLADYAVLAFAIVTLLSTILSPYKDALNLWIGIPEPEGRYDGAITQLLYAAAFLIVAHWYVPRIRHFMFFGASATLIGLIGILQFYGMDFLKLWPVDEPRYHVENLYDIPFRSTLGNVDIVATYVCVAIILCGFLYIRYQPTAMNKGGRKSKGAAIAALRQPLWLLASALNFWLMELANADSGRVGLLVALLFGLPFIIESLKTLGRFLILASSWAAVFTLQKLFYNVLVQGERTAMSLLPYAGAFAVLLAAGIILTRLGKERDHKAPAKWLLGVILIVACIVVGIVGVEYMGRRDVQPGESGGIIYEVREVLHGRVRDEFGTNRVYIWRNALSVFPKHPVIGSGPDTFELVFPTEAQGLYGQKYDKAHSEYIQLLICQGILGLLFYVVFIVGASIKAIPKAFKNPLVMAVLAAFATYCAQAIFNISLPIASQMLWILAGMLANKRFRSAKIKELA